MDWNRKFFYTASSDKVLCFLPQTVRQTSVIVPTTSPFPAEGHAAYKPQGHIGQNKWTVLAAFSFTECFPLPRKEKKNKRERGK